MAKPLSRIRKVRSLDEIITRGGQAISAYRDQRGGIAVPSNEGFTKLIDESQFGSAPIIAESLWQMFFKNGSERFFPSFQDRAVSVPAFRATFDDATADRFIAAADSIAEGRIDLLGLKGLYVGTDIDWLREPLSAKRSPLKHWKDFDDLDTESGNKKIVWELNRHQHFFTLGVAFWLTGDEKYGEVFARHLSSWIEQNPPGLGVNWSSSLEIAFRSMSWIWAFHFFKDSDHLTPSLFLDALKHLHRHGRHIERYLSKYYSPNTHLTGEGLGLYYLGTQLPFFKRAERWRKLGENILTTEIEKQILPDGVYFEQSLWYQRYSVDFYLHFVILRSLFGGPYLNTDAARVEDRLQTAFDWMMSVTQPDGSTPLIGDDDGGRTLPLTKARPDDFRGSLAVSAIIFDRADHKFVSGNIQEDVFWLTGSDGIAAYNRLNAVEPELTSTDLRDGGYCVMRDGWSDADNHLIVDAGEVGALSGGHGHADALSIVASINGQPLLIDSGTYTYHESSELRDYFRSTSAHNTLEIDGLSSSEPGSAFAWRTRANATIDRWISIGRFDYFEGSHDGYRRLASPATHTRSILFLKGDYWIIRDVVETDGEHAYSLNFHFHPSVATMIGEPATWIGGDGYRIHTFGDNGTWEQKESWVSTNHGNRVNAPLMRFVSHGLGKQEFWTFILPADEHNEPEVTEVDSPTGRAFVIRHRGYSDTLLFNDTPGEAVETAAFESDFRYSWARLSDGQSLPDEFVAIDGSLFVLGDTAVVDSRDENHASGRRLGSDVYITTDAGRSVRSV